MAHERWMKMVEPYDSAVGISSDVVVTLLARQHRAMVRKIKRLADQSQSYDVQEFTVRLLAALKAVGEEGRG